MKSKSVFFILMAFFIFSCTSHHQNDLTEEQKSAIKTEIDRLWNISGEGIIERDAEKAFSVFSALPDARYVAEGEIRTDIVNVKNQYAEGFKNPDPVKQKMSIDQVHYDFLDASNVLLTLKGSLAAVNDSAGSRLWVIAYTLLWRKEETGWKLFNMHMSWK